MTDITIHLTHLCVVVFPEARSNSMTTKINMDVSFNDCVATYMVRLQRSHTISVAAWANSIKKIWRRAAENKNWGHRVSQFQAYISYCIYIRHRPMHEDVIYVACTLATRQQQRWKHSGDRTKQRKKEKETDRQTSKSVWINWTRYAGATERNKIESISIGPNSVGIEFD